MKITFAALVALSCALAYFDWTHPHSQYLGAGHSDPVGYLGLAAIFLVIIAGVLLEDPRRRKWIKQEFGFTAVSAVRLLVVIMSAVLAAGGMASIRHPETTPDLPYVGYVIVGMALIFCFIAAWSGQRHRKEFCLPSSPSLISNRARL